MLTSLFIDKNNIHNYQQASLAVNASEVIIVFYA
jgi:hypothetical protein